MKDLVLQLDRQGTLLEQRGAAESMWLPSGKNEGRNIFDLLPADAAQPLRNCLEEALLTRELQIFEYQPAMSEHHYELRFVSGSDDTVFVIITNISEYKNAAERVKYLANHDALTGLPNRYLFNDRLTQAIAHAEREKQLLSVLFLDIDNFKHINDTMGHKAGDQLLQAIASRLQLGMRRTDSISRLSRADSEQMVARLGGDEFTMLLTDVKNVEDAARVARRVLSALSEPFVVGAQEVFVTASVGIAVYPADGKDIDTLLINADVAMYQAKNRGRNNFQYYSESLNTFSFERFTIENKLRKAIDHNEFMLFYQPQVDLRTGKLMGVEALLRWLQPDLVLIKPGQFVPLAEQTGLIIPIGEWVLRTACVENMAWQKAGLPAMCMTVNVSGIQFAQDNFVEGIYRVLKDTGLDPNRLQLELTESTIMQDSQNTVKKLHSLREMGVQVAIDDFGAGYSSLNYLKRFPLSSLKIDASFIRDLITSSNDRAIVKAIIQLAHNFSLQVIAEGVENTKQLAFLREFGCEGAQGYLICPPVNSAVLAEFARKEKNLAVLKGRGIKA